MTNDVSGIKFNEGNIMIRRLLLLLYRISGFFSKEKGQPKYLVYLKYQGGCRKMSSAPQNSMN